MKSRRKSLDSTWLAIAKELAPNSKTRDNCDCGSGKTLVISRDHKTYSCYCFRCGYQRYSDVGTLSLEELAKIKELNKQAKEVRLTVELPEDFTEDIPLIGRLWLYKGGVGPSLWKKYSIGWSDTLQRVIMPIFDNSKLVWFQARAVHPGQMPKYIGPDGDRSTLVFKTGEHTGKSVTVVEDMMSAYRVGEITATCSLLGTKITTAQANILGQYDLVTTWLDDDAAGKRGAYDVRRAVGLVTEVRNISTTKDPKCYSREEIVNILGVTNGST